MSRACHRPNTAAIWHQPIKAHPPTYILVTTADEAEACLKFLRNHIPREDANTYGITQEAQ